MIWCVSGLQCKLCIYLEMHFLFTGALQLEYVTQLSDVL